MCYKVCLFHTGIDSLPPIPGAWVEHIKRAHLQAHIWAQDDVLNPKILDPTTLGWEDVDGILKPKLSCVQLTPESVVELLKCSCNKSRCSSARCTCRQNNLPCTELCKCEAGVDCENIPTTIIENDAEEN